SRIYASATFRFFFFFQAEDGIRDPLVTGVQTCALPICPMTLGTRRSVSARPERHRARDRARNRNVGAVRLPRLATTRAGRSGRRSEERRVGREGRSGRATRRRRGTLGRLGDRGRTHARE